MIEVASHVERPSLAALRAPSQSPALDTVFDLARTEGGVTPPLPVAAVDFLKPSEDSGEISPFRVRAHCADAPREFPELRGDGMAGLILAVQRLLGQDFSMLAPGLDPERYRDLLEVVGGASVYSVVDSGAALVARLRTLQEAYFMAGHEACHRSTPLGLAISKARDRFEQLPGAVELTPDQREVVGLFQRLFPFSPPEQMAFFSGRFLNQLARPFYERAVNPDALKVDEPFRLEFHPPGELEDNILPLLSPEDFRVLVMGDMDQREAGPFAAFRPLLVSLLPPTISLEPWPERLRSKYPSQWAEWVRRDPGLEARLQRLPVVTVDQLSTLESVWKVPLSLAEQALLADFLNGTVEDARALGVLLQRLFKDCGILSGHLGRRTGRSNGVFVFVENLNHVDSDSQALVQALTGPPLSGAGAPRFFCNTTRGELQRFAVEGVLGARFSDYGGAEGVAQEGGEALSASAAASVLKELLQGHARLAYLAWSRSRREVISEESTLQQDRLVLGAYEGVPIEQIYLAQVFVRQCPFFNLRTVDRSVNRWVIFSKDVWWEVEPALLPEDPDASLLKDCQWIAPSQLALPFLWSGLRVPFVPGGSDAGASVAMDRFGYQQVQAELANRIRSKAVGVRYGHRRTGQTTGSTTDAHNAFIADLLARSTELGLLEGPAHVEFNGSDGQRLRIPRTPFKLTGPQQKFFNWLMSLSAFPLDPSRPDRLLTEAAVDRVAAWTTPGPTQPFSVFEVQDRLFRNGEEVPFSSLCRLIQARLPEFLRRVFASPEVTLQPPRFDVNTVQERLENDFPNTFAFLNREGFNPGELAGMDLVTEAQVRESGLAAAWGLTEDRVPFLVDFLNGRVRDDDEARALIHRLLGTTQPAVLVWDVHRPEVDAATRALLTERVNSSPSGAQASGILMAVAVPYPSDELGVGIDFLAGPLAQAQQAFLDRLVTTSKLDEALFGELRRWLLMVARHENTARSGVLIQTCMDALLGAFKISDADGFWADKARDRRAGKRMPLIAMRFLDLFLEVFLVQGKESVDHGYLEEAVPAWSMVHRAYEYLLASMDSSALPLDANELCEGRYLLPRVDLGFAFLADFCLASDKVPGFDNPLDAVRVYREWYQRFYGPQAQAVANTSAVGRYLRIVEAYKSRQNAEVLKQAGHFLPETTNESYLDRLITYLNKACPAAVEKVPKGYLVGMPGYAHVQAMDDRVVMPVAVVAMEACYLLAAGGKDSAVHTQHFRHFAHQLSLLRSANPRGWQWTYQGAMNEEHFERQVVGNIDAAERHARAMAVLLRGRPPSDPEWVRVEHWFAEAHRGRFQQHLARVQSIMATPRDTAMPSTWLNLPLEEGLKALYRERRLIARAERLRGDPSVPRKVDDREWLMYRCTELELVLNLMEFLARMETHYVSSGQSQVPRQVLQDLLPFIPERANRSASVALGSLGDHLEETSWLPGSLEDLLRASQAAALEHYRDSSNQYRYWFAGYTVLQFDHLLEARPDLEADRCRTDWLLFLKHLITTDLETDPAKRVEMRVSKDFGADFLRRVVTCPDR